MYPNTMPGISEATHQGLLTVKVGKSALLALFVLLIVLLNSFGLIICAINESANISLLFYAKESSIVLIFSLMVFTTVRYRIDAIDGLVFILLTGTFVLTMINVSEPQMIAYRLKFYALPLLLLTLGKHFFKTIDDTTIGKILYAIMFVVMLLGYFYFYLFVVNASFFQDANLIRLFKAQYGTHSAMFLIQGFKPNSFSHYGGQLIKRAFGPFFDPLMTGFFLAPLLYNCRYSLHQRKTLTAWVSFLLLFVLLALTQTRAIIIAFIFVCFAVRFGPQHLKVISTRLLVFLLISLIVMIIYYFDHLRKSVDPSTRGHLAAYYTIINQFATGGVREYLLGWKVTTKTSFGAESMFTSMVNHNGVFYYVLFNVLVYLAFLRLRNAASSRVQYIALSSLITYYLASFTTEHWFATTSCSLFWILLGISLGNKFPQSKNIICDNHEETGLI